MLARLPKPADAAKVISERQQVANAEAEQCEIIEDYLAQQLAGLGYTENDKVFIPVGTACDWYNRAMNERKSTAMVSRAHRQQITEGAIKSN